MQTPESVSGELVLAPRSDHSPAVRGASIRDQLAGMWLLAQRSPNTEAAYRRDIQTFFEWADLYGVEVLTAIQVHIDAYRRWLGEPDRAHRRYRGSRTLTDSTIARKLVVVSSFYRYAVRNSQGMVMHNPAEFAARPEVANESMTAGLDREEAERLLAAAAAGGHRLRALVLVLLGTGMRVSELIRADTGDLSFERGHRILTVTRKGGKRQRIGLPAAADAALREYVGNRQGPLFLDSADRERMTRQQVTYYLRQLGRAAGLQVVVTPHVLRHTAATLALNDGAPLRDVQVQLGHARPDTTARYDRARRDLDNAAARSLAALVDQVAQ